MTWVARDRGPYGCWVHGQLEAWMHCVPVVQLLFLHQLGQDLAEQLDNEWKRRRVPFFEANVPPCSKSGPMKRDLAPSCTSKGSKKRRLHSGGAKSDKVDVADAEHEVIPEAAKPEEFEIRTDSEDEAEVSPDKLDVADADHDGRNGQSLSTFQPNKCLVPAVQDSVDDRAAFGKDEVACEPLLTSDFKAEHEVIPEEPKRYVGKPALREMDVKGLEGVQKPPLNQEQLLHPNEMYLPEDSWPILLEFLPVAEVVNKETRAVSRFFSSSKIWLAHLLKLMDIDSLPQRSGKKTHPASEFSQWWHALRGGNADHANELERCASEGFQGYRAFFNGLLMWNAQYPQMLQPFLTTVTQWFLSGQGVLTGLGKSFCGLMLQEFPSVRRPILVGLSSLTRTKGLSPDRYESFICLLRCCISVYQHLERDSVADLLVSVRGWTDESLRLRCLREIVFPILNMVLTDDSDAVLVNRCCKHMLNFEKQGELDKAAAQLQKMLDLLLEKQSS